MTILSDSSQSQELCTIYINIQANKSQCDLIDSAAQIVGKTRNDFMWETACREAESVLMGQDKFLLDENQWDAFINALDAPVQSRPRLEKLMSERTVSEK